MIAIQILPDDEDQYAVSVDLERGPVVVHIARRPERYKIGDPGRVRVLTDLTNRPMYAEEARILARMLGQAADLADESVDISVCYINVR